VRTKWTLACAAIVTVGMTVDAHHSISGAYDSSRRETVEGIVAEFQFINPHPFLLIDVDDGAGKAHTWWLEMDNRRELVAVGVTANTFKPGDRITVTGSLSRSQRKGLYVLRLDRPADGFWYEQVGQSPRIRNP
jgi:DNA/RNA endonuclease YhcR with UshA esterase domain